MAFADSYDLEGALLLFENAKTLFGVDINAQSYSAIIHGCIVNGDSDAVLSGPLPRQAISFFHSLPCLLLVLRCVPSQSSSCLSLESPFSGRSRAAGGALVPEQR